MAQKPPSALILPTLCFPLVHSLGKDIDDANYCRIMSNQHKYVVISVEFYHLFSSLQSIRTVMVHTFPVRYIGESLECFM